MAVTALSTLTAFMNVPRCPEPIQLQALRQAALRFCIQSERWREDMTAFVTVADQEDYTLTVPYTDVRILRVTQVKVDDVVQLETKWSISESLVLTLDPAQTADDLDVVVSVVYVPDLLCASLVDWLVQRYGDVIAYGAESYLKVSTQVAGDPVPWADPQTGSIAEARFVNGVNEAKMEVFTSMQSGAIGVQQMSFYL